MTSCMPFQKTVGVVVETEDAGKAAKETVYTWFKASCNHVWLSCQYNYRSREEGIVWAGAKS